MNREKYIEEVEIVILDIIGVGTLMLISSVKSYMKRKMAKEMDSIIKKHDLSIGIDDMVDNAIISLLRKGAVINIGAKIKRPCDEIKKLNY